MRFGLLALTGAIIGATSVYAQHHGVDASITAVPVVTFATMTVMPSEDDVISAYATAERPIPTLPTVHVSVTEEERIAAMVDPTDRIQIMSQVTVTASAEEVAAAMQTAIIAQAESGSIDDSSSSFGRVINAAISGPRRLRLDMPYYSVGRVLTRAQKN
ncbi:MAG: hypothetical protein ABI846_16055 [Rudaea sp.]